MTEATRNDLSSRRPSRIPGWLRPAARNAYRLLSQRRAQLGRLRWLRPVLRLAYRQLSRRRSWMRPHPFDVQHGVDTGGYLPWWLLGGAGQPDPRNNGYGGCQPSCLRRALSTVADPGGRTFLDLGCGKGRALAVASEFAFHRIVGVEIDPGLSRTASANAAAVRARYPARRAIEVVQADVVRFPFPPGGLVVFIYHAFGLALFRQLAERLVRDTRGAAMILVYQNPMFGAVLDAMPELRRWFAETVACDADEQGVGSGVSETVVCWVYADDPAPSWPGSDAAIDPDPSGARLRAAAP